MDLLLRDEKGSADAAHELQSPVAAQYTV